MATRTIQIAPYREDTRFEGNKIIGTMKNEDGTITTYTFEADEKNAEFTKEVQDSWAHFFSAAIALSSKTWQIEYMFEQAGVKGKMSYERK